MDFYRKAVAALSAAAGPSDDFVGRQLKMDKLNIRVKKGIAEGGYGMVYLCEDDQGNQYALKRMLATERPRAVLIKKEIDMLKAASSSGNKRVVKLVHAAASPLDRMSSSNPAEFLILTELCPGGHVMEAVQKRGTPLSLPQVISYFRQACEAVEGLHNMTPKVIHRDIKLENFLIAVDGSVKLCDFGSATTDVVVTKGKSYTEMNLLTEEIEKNTTPQNRTPEMLDMHLGYDINEKADIWALGCALYCLCFRVHPFEDAMKLGIINAKYKLPESSGYACFNDMIRSCLTIDPSKRPSATQLIKSLDQLAQSLGVPSKVEPINTPTKSMFNAQTSESTPSAVSSGTSRMSSLLSKAKAQAGNLIDSAKNKGTKVIRSVTARDTNRHGGLAGELDLTYITPKMIAMAFPSEGVASTYRNGIVELKAYLEQAHQLHDILVVNVADKSYDPHKLGCKVVSFPWAAGQAPYLEQLFTLCHTIQAWQLQNPRHLVAVHCHNGKAETGTALAAYFTYCKLLGSYKDAVKLFSLKRVTTRRPVLSPSQERYVSYISEIVNNRFPSKSPLMLENIKLSHAPAFNATNNGCRPYVNVYQHGELVHSSGTATGFANLKSFNKDEPILINLGCIVEGDVMVEVLHARTILGHLSPVVMCRFQFHTGYVSGSNISLPRFEVDEALRSNKFNGAFAIHVGVKVAVSKTASFPAPWEDPKAQQQERGGAARTCFNAEKEYEDLKRDFEIIKSSFTDRESISEQGDAPGVMLSDDETETYDDAKPVASPVPDVVLPAHFEEPMEPPFAEESSSSAAEPSLLDFGGEPQQHEQQQQPSVSKQTSSSSQSQQVNLLDDLFSMSLDGGKRTPSSASSNNLFELGASSQPSPAAAKKEEVWDPFGNLTSSSSSAAPASQPAQAPKADDFGDFFASPAAPSASTTQVPVFDPFNNFGAAPAPAPAAAPAPAVFDPFGNIGSSAAAAPKPAPAAQPAQRSSSTSDDPFAFLDPTLAAKKAQAQPAPATASASVPLSAMSTGAAPAASSGFANFQSAPAASSSSSGNLWTNTDWLGAPSSSSKPAQQQPAQQQASKPGAAPAAAAGINFMTKPGKPVVSENAFDDLLSDPRFQKPEAKPTTMQAMKQEQLKKTEDPVILAVDTWAEGKENNVRALLSSLQNILWEGAKWTPKQFHELVEPDAVRKAYQRACLCVHPDRNRGSANEQLAHEIFIRLSTAFQEFENSGAKALF